MFEINGNARVLIRKFIVTGLPIEKKGILSKKFIKSTTAKKDLIDMLLCIQLDADIMLLKYSTT